MATEDKNDAPSGGRPFQLRPSILSGSGFGSSFSSGAVGEKNKGFMLRPSALSSAADKLETNKDTRKRQLSGDEEKPETKEEPLKKPKVLEEGETETKSDTKKAESSLKLTEDIEKPTGIGSFGFADEKDSDKNKNGQSETNNEQSKTTNYFSQKVNAGDKLGFVFGGTAASSGFNAIKNTNDADSSKDESGADKSTGDADVEGFQKTASHEKLLEQASEYEKSHNNRQHFEEIDKFTGEEGEQHVLQIICKLHVFEKERKVWLERGRGTLRLNDICQTEGCFQSRLVFRTQGTNLVQLNTKLFPEMCCEKVKEKNVRISAMDPETQEVKVYLITASIKDVLLAYTAIERRLGALKRGQRETADTSEEKGEIPNQLNDNDEKST